MSVDIAIECACGPRERLGSAGLLAALKARTRVDLVETLPRQHRVPPEQLRVEFETGDAPLDYPGLRRAASVIDGLESACRDCPANLWRAAFGCLSAIRYPISGAAERWLIERLPSDLSRRPGADLVRAISDFAISGVRGQQMRTRGFLEAKDPAIRSFDGLTVSSDQLLELLLFAKHGEAAMRMLLLLFGAVEPVPEESILAAYQGLMPLTPVLLPEDGEDPSISDFKRLFLSLLVASRLGVPVGVAP